MHTITRKAVFLHQEWKQACVVKIRIVIVFFFYMLNDDSWNKNYLSTIASKSVFRWQVQRRKRNTFLQCQWNIFAITRFRHSGVLSAQGSTMGTKKLDKIVRTYDRTYVLTSTPACKPGWNFSFQASARFGGKSHGHLDFYREINNNNKPESFFRLKILMSTLTCITEKELELEIKHKGHQFRWKRTWKFYSGGEKIRNASGHWPRSKWAAVKKMRTGTFSP